MYYSTLARCASQHSTCVHFPCVYCIQTAVVQLPPALIHKIYKHTGTWVLCVCEFCTTHDQHARSTVSQPFNRPGCISRYNLQHPQSWLTLPSLMSWWTNHWWSPSCISQRKVLVPTVMWPQFINTHSNIMSADMFNLAHLHLQSAVFQKARRPFLSASLHPFCRWSECRTRNSWALCCGMLSVIYRLLGKTTLRIPLSQPHCCQVAWSNKFS